MSREDDGEGYIRYGRINPELDRLRSCEGKRKFKTQAEADADARSMKRRGVNWNPRGYKCRHCDGFHVGAPQHGA